MSWFLLSFDFVSPPSCSGISNLSWWEIGRNCCSDPPCSHIYPPITSIPAWIHVLFRSVETVFDYIKCPIIFLNEPFFYFVRFLFHSESWWWVWNVSGVKDLKASPFLQWLLLQPTMRHIDGKLDNADKKLHPIQHDSIIKKINNIHNYYFIHNKFDLNKVEDSWTQMIDQKAFDKICFCCNLSFLIVIVIFFL